MNQKGNKKSNLIFLKNDKLSDEALNACKALHIDPSMLAPKQKESFKESDITAAIAEIRYYHYEDKRKCLIQEVEDYIKTGGMNTTMSTFNKSNFLAREFKKMRMGHSPFYSEKPDIPLR